MYKNTRIVFLGAATHERCRIHRPTLPQIATLTKGGATVALVDPDYSLTTCHNGFDADLRNNPIVYAMSGLRYFQHNPLHDDELLVLYDFTGARTRTSLVEHDLLNSMDQIRYYPIGCEGTYQFITEFEENPPYNELFTLSWDIGPYLRPAPNANKYPPNILLAKNELEEYVNDMCNLIAYIKGRFFMNPPADWTLYQDRYGAGRVGAAPLIYKIQQWYKRNINNNIGDANDFAMWLDKARQDVRRFYT